MQPAVHLLIQYAAYHRDRRNIASHFVGVPLIVFAIGMLLARPSFSVFGVALTPAWIAFALAAGWYLTRGSLVLGVVVTAAVGALVFVAQKMAALDTAAWLAWGLCTFIVGWLIQFAGHWYEGRKPAFYDDVTGLLIGPMFIAAEALFAVGWNQPLQQQIERRVGPTSLRDLARIA